MATGSFLPTALKNSPHAESQGHGQICTKRTKWSLRPLQSFRTCGITFDKRGRPRRRPLQETQAPGAQGCTPHRPTHLSSLTPNSTRGSRDVRICPEAAALRCACGHAGQQGPGAGFSSQAGPAGVTCSGTLQGTQGCGSRAREDRQAYTAR